MCGIAGVLGPDGGNTGLLRAMGDTLIHRGPDDSGVWTDAEAGIGLAHRRLSIVDISPLGHQPMISADGRWVLCYNGEIYNHLAIRADLAAVGQVPDGGWRGHSDTETLVHAIAIWGVEAALQRATGMFALGVWDRQERQLHLARDRFGEKPLYFGRVGRDFVFASELKAIRAHPEFAGEIDRDALAAFAALTVIPAPQSIYRGIRKLEPASILSIDVSGTERLKNYWSYRDVVLDGLVHPIRDEQQALEELDHALRVAIAGQAVADVPVGAFLSGGVDSSAIVALYQAVSGSPVRTYTIGFDETGYDESEDARKVADHLGTTHHEHRIGVTEAQAVIPLLPTIYDEPFADSSQIPAYLVSKFARGDVAVVMSGDGGDELFAGYNRHRIAPAMWQRMQRLPAPLRKMAGRVPAGAFALLARLGGERRAGLGAKAAKAAQVMGSARDLDAVYDSFLDEWYGLGSPVIDGQVRERNRDLPLDIPDLVRLTYADAVGYLPDDILTKIDRAAMAVSLETRVPFLDHHVAAVAARIDPALKVRGRIGKYLLRQFLYRHVPQELVDRPKMGFAVPVGEWVWGPLRDWAESLLSRQRLEQEGYWDADLVRRRWEGHLARRTATPAIWSVLMFQAWLDVQKE